MRRSITGGNPAHRFTARGRGNRLTAQAAISITTTEGISAAGHNRRRA